MTYIKFLWGIAHENIKKTCHLGNLYYIYTEDTRILFYKSIPVLLNTVDYTLIDPNFGQLSNYLAILFGGATVNIQGLFNLFSTNFFTPLTFLNFVRNQTSIKILSYTQPTFYLRYLNQPSRNVATVDPEGFKSTIKDNTFFTIPNRIPNFITLDVLQNTVHDRKAARQILEEYATSFKGEDQSDPRYTVPLIPRFQSALASLNICFHPSTVELINMGTTKVTAWKLHQADCFSTDSYLTRRSLPFELDPSAVCMSNFQFIPECDSDLDLMDRLNLTKKKFLAGLSRSVALKDTTSSPVVENLFLNKFTRKVYVSGKVFSKGVFINNEDGLFRTDTGLYPVIDFKERWYLAQRFTPDSCFCEYAAKSSVQCVHME